MNQWLAGLAYIAAAVLVGAVVVFIGLALFDWDTALRFLGPRVA